MRRPIKFVVFAPRYVDTHGGAVVLYKLCQLLKKQGCDVTVWHERRPYRISSWKSVVWFFLYHLDRLLRPASYRSPHDIDIASRSDMRDAIVIYPEIVGGNPLEAAKVVRWFLHKPGHHTGEIRYGQGELYFFFRKEFDDPDINPSPENELRVFELMSHVYRQTNFGKRSGTCYLIRKGFARAHDYHPKDAVLLDGLPHDKMAAAFNRHEYFISYDLYTMYSRFAAVCGCKSIVVPMEGLDKSVWSREERDSFGIAYGYDDLPWAITTRQRLIAMNRQIDDESERSVENFVECCQTFFKLAQGV